MEERKIVCDYCGSFMDGGYKLTRIISNEERVQMVMRDLTPIDLCSMQCVESYAIKLNKEE